VHEEVEAVEAVEVTVMLAVNSKKHYLLSLATLVDHVLGKIHLASGACMFLGGKCWLAQEEAWDA